MCGFEFSKSRPGSIREPAVAGLFYPDEPGELQSQVTRFLDDVSASPAQGRVLALVAPHAGYPYSGRVAAHSYKLLKEQQPTRVVVIAPSHLESFPGAAIYPGSHYRTPLGNVPVDRSFAERLAAAGGADLSERGHLTGRGGRGEHSLEVQLPFLQSVLSRFGLVPIVLGSQDLGTCRKLGSALADLVDEETVIVASSDLSHYHPDEEARQLDASAIALVRNWDYFSLVQNVDSGECEACGAGPIAAAMIAAQQAGGNRCEILAYSNSGDIPPFRRDGVVGYLSAALIADEAEIAGPTQELGPDARRSLLQVCRQALNEAVGERSPDEPDAQAAGLDRAAAVFVTLRSDGQLRGCVGSIVAREPLAQAVRNATISAATLDTRFAPVSASELDSIDCDISVLSPFRLVRRIDEIEVGRDGLLIERSGRRGLLLPQVAAEHGWDLREFLRNTCLKAGLGVTDWQLPDTVIYRFSAQIVEGGQG